VIRETTIRLDPGATRRTERLLLLVPGSARLLITTPGDYEFFVTCRPWADPQRVIRTQPIVIGVDGPDGSDEDAALSRYVSDGLTELVAAWPWPQLNAAKIARARAFLTAFPSTRYSDHVREAVFVGLGHRVVRGTATPEDEALLAEMEAGRRQRPN
jgi:hypothetical protein